MRMKPFQKASVMVGLVCFTGGAVSASLLGGLLKGGGIAYLVSHFGGDINKAINKVTHTPTNNPMYSTKVVPVLSAGVGTYVGAVQVMGPRAAINKVQAVAQFETGFSPLGIRLRGLVPVSTKGVTSIHRVPGVGITGLLDMKL